MPLDPETTLEALLQKRERAATRRILSFLTNAALDSISDHAFVVRRWHTFSRRVESFLKTLQGISEGDALMREFYSISDEIEGSDMTAPENPKPVIIRHVKWKIEDGRIVPTANTKQFEKLPALNRGTLIFVPEDEDYDEERDEFSR